MIKKWGILIKEESKSIEFIGLKIPRDYYYEKGNMLCWSKKSNASIFIQKTSENIKKVNVSYRKLLPNSKIKILLNGKEVFRDEDEVVQKKIVLDMPFGNELYGKITFLVDQLRCPAICFGSGDYRYLGIGLENIRLE